jgi:multidrug efflux pump subunit AcrB
MTCPQCGSSDIRTSRHARWSNVFQRIRGREAFRCRACRKRFFASPSTDPGPQQAIQAKQTHRHAKLISTRSRKRLVRRLVVISIFALAFIAFLLFLRYLTTEKSPSQDSGAVSSHLTSSPSHPA